MTASIVSDSKKILKDIHTGNVEVLKRFHENYPDKHWTCLRYEKTGDTILHVASRLGYLNLIDYILNNYQLKAVDCRNNDNKTALHEAAQFGQAKAVELLLKNGAEIDALKKADWTPLMLACTKVNQSEFKDEHYKTVEVLLRGGAEVNYRNKDGWTALHLIAREGEVRILELLLGYGLNLEAITRNGRSALHIAALHGNFDMTSKLIRLGFEVNKQDSCGNTPLHESILGANLKISKLLLDNNADLHCRNKSDFTILHLAAAQGNIDVIDYIISTLKFEINVRTASGLTPLHCAARINKQKDAYDFLVSKGADVNIKDNFGRTASDYL